MGAPLGKPKTPEHRAKIAATLKDRPKSDAHRAAIGVGVKAFWESPDGQQIRETLRKAANARRLAQRAQGGQNGR